MGQRLDPTRQERAVRATEPRRYNLRYFAYGWDKQLFADVVAITSRLRPSREADARPTGCCEPISQLNKMQNQRLVWLRCWLQ
jgi:hypothetical protein